MVAEIEKELSPLKAKKRKLKKLSQKSREDSTAIGEKNSAILRERMTQKFPSIPISERLPIISRPITIPTAEPMRESNKSANKNSPHQTGSATIKPILRPIRADSNVRLSSLVHSDDEYDEGGFTPRPQKSIRSSLNKLPKIPSIAREPSIFITAPNELLP